MDIFFNNIVGKELFFVYGLIALVIILIIVIIVIDKRESRKKPKNLFDTLNMKIIQTNDINDKPVKEENIEVNIVTQNEKVENDFSDLEPIEPVSIISQNETLKETLESIEDEVYVESDLEKTQAQIRVEEITNALKDAQVDKKIEEDKYAKFEEEQEKNAIISYNELKESFDRLYDENEKIQYLEDDEIPININELYELRDKEEIEKVKLDDFSDFKKPEPVVQSQSTSTFKSSPLISPVYGIQTPPVEIKKHDDIEIQDANLFLQSLKELKNNLD